MKPVDLNQIESFLSNQDIILYGVSSTEYKMGNSIFKELRDKNYNVLPIHRTLDKIGDANCFKNIKEVPGKPDAAVICTKEQNTAEILEELKLFGINNVWLQQGSAGKELIDKALNSFPNVIYGKCIMMFANQKGIHKFHARILKFFGRYPNR